MYYQELGSDNKLRKIKVKVKDLSKIEKVADLKFGDDLNIELPGKEDTVIFDSYEFVDSFTYRFNSCNTTTCYNGESSYEVPENYKVLKLTFASVSYEAKNMVDFISRYGKLIYKDSDDEVIDEKVIFAINRSYFGKTVYLLVPVEVSESKDIKLSFIVRNKSYIYDIV